MLTRLITLTNIGLTLDILGAILIFVFGLPGVLTEAGKKGQALYFTESHTEEERREIQSKVKQIIRRNRILSGIGVFLLILGFTLQIAGNTIR